MQRQVDAMLVQAVQDERVQVKQNDGGEFSTLKFEPTLRKQLVIGSLTPPTAPVQFHKFPSFLEIHQIIQQYLLPDEGYVRLQPPPLCTPPCSPICAFYRSRGDEWRLYEYREQGHKSKQLSHQTHLQTAGGRNIESVLDIIFLFFKRTRNSSRHTSHQLGIF